MGILLLLGTPSAEAAGIRAGCIEVSTPLVPVTKDAGGPCPHPLWPLPEACFIAGDEADRYPEAEPRTGQACDKPTQVEDPCLAARHGQNGTTVFADPSCYDPAHPPVLPGMGRPCETQPAPEEPPPPPPGPPPPPPPPPPTGGSPPEPCCGGQPCCDPNTARCQVAMSMYGVRKRVGAELAGHGVCLDVGQEENGTPYVDFDPDQSCTAHGGG